MAVPLFVAASRKQYRPWDMKRSAVGKPNEPSLIQEHTLPRGSECVPPPEPLRPPQCVASLRVAGEASEAQEIIIERAYYRKSSVSEVLTPKLAGAHIFFNRRIRAGFEQASPVVIDGQSGLLKLNDAKNDSWELSLSTVAEVTHKVVVRSRLAVLDFHVFLSLKHALIHGMLSHLYNCAQTAADVDDPNVDAATPPVVLEFANLTSDFVFRKVGSRCFWIKLLWWSVCSPNCLPPI